MNNLKTFPYKQRKYSFCPHNYLSPDTIPLFPGPKAKAGCQHIMVFFPGPEGGAWAPRSPSLLSWVRQYLAQVPPAAGNRYLLLQATGTPNRRQQVPLTEENRYLLQQATGTSCSRQQVSLTAGNRNPLQQATGTTHRRQQVPPTAGNRCLPQQATGTS